MILLQLFFFCFVFGFNILHFHLFISASFAYEHVVYFWRRQSNYLLFCFFEWCVFLAKTRILQKLLRLARVCNYFLHYTIIRNLKIMTNSCLSISTPSKPSERWASPWLNIITIFLLKKNQHYFEKTILIFANQTRILSDLNFFHIYIQFISCI
jgi:hypothetical protein